MDAKVNDFDAVNIFYVMLLANKSELLSQPNLLLFVVNKPYLNSIHFYGKTACKKS